eukprot:TRINITY_DN1816_c1_g1_i2.p2 TRINITY_DN1816_c1_g1~~TRINITY_DN1816_c1_g1_i2.p2  ORF type:complete len:161 (-),score=6.81 TRINITY_DN1816_c1_g1_i2:218-700(-)
MMRCPSLPRCTAEDPRASTHRIGTDHGQVPTATAGGFVSAERRRDVTAGLVRTRDIVHVCMAASGPTTPAGDLRRGRRRLSLLRSGCTSWRVFASVVCWRVPAFPSAGVATVSMERKRSPVMDAAPLAKRPFGEKSPRNDAQQLGGEMPQRCDVHCYPLP